MYSSQSTRCTYLRRRSLSTICWLILYIYSLSYKNYIYIRTRMGLSSVVSPRLSLTTLYNGTRDSNSQIYSNIYIRQSALYRICIICTYHVLDVAIALSFYLRTNMCYRHIISVREHIYGFLAYTYILLTQ